MPPTDAIAVLKSDHDAVDDLFKKFDALGERAHKGKQDVAADICRELTIHAAIEEEIFYPRVRQAGRELKDEVLEGVEEHRHIKEGVAALETLSAEDETFDAKVKVLKEQVQHHVKEEEDEMFPRVHKALGDDELSRLGEQLTDAKTRRAADQPGGR